MKTPDPEFTALASTGLYGLGWALKLIPKFPDWAIPITLLAAGGTAFGVGLQSGSVSETAVNAMFGVAAASAIVGAHTATKQAIQRK